METVPFLLFCNIGNPPVFWRLRPTVREGREQWRERFHTQQSARSENETLQGQSFWNFRAADVQSGPTYAWRHHPFIMVGVDTHVVILQVKGVLAELDMLELILVEVRPAPQPCVYHMGKTFPPCHLETQQSIIRWESTSVKEGCLWRQYSGSGSWCGFVFVCLC